MRPVALGCRLQPESETMRAGLALAILIGTSWTAAVADSGPVIVIPGRALRQQREGKGTQVERPGVIYLSGSPSLASRPCAMLAGDDNRD